MSEEAEWIEYFDEDENRPYFFNPITQETVWERPGGHDDDESGEESESGEEEDDDHKHAAAPAAASSGAPVAPGSPNTLGAAPPKGLAKSLSAFRMAKTGVATPDTTEAGQAPALPQLPTMKPAIPAMPTTASAPAVFGSSEPSAEELLEGIKSMSTSHTILMYAKAHFRKPKERAYKKNRSLEQRLRWQNDLISKPFHKISKKLYPDAVKLFTLILTYMGDKSSSDLPPPKIAQSISELMIRTTSLRDEGLCQMCKQTTKNPRLESLTKGWELISLVCGCIEPSTKFRPYLEEYLKSHVGRQDEIGSLARSAQERLERLTKLGSRIHVPFLGEIEATLKKQPIIIKVWFLDETHKTLEFRQSLTNREITDIVGEKKRLRDSGNFSLFEYKGTTEIRMLRDNEQVLDPMGRWAYEDEKALKKKEIKPNEVGTRWRYVFKPKLILSTMEDVSDPECIDLLYIHSVYNVLCGNYSCTAEDAVKMAALQLQAVVGDHNPETIKKGIVASQLEKYVPVTWINSRTPEEWERVLFELHKRLVGRTSLDAKLNYLSYVKRRPLYGASFFYVTQRNQFKEVPESIIVAVNQDGVQLLKPGITKEKVTGYPFSEIVSWAFTSNTFTFVTGDLAHQQKFTVETTRGAEISAVCRGYVEALLQNDM
eukprot:c15784_g1_i1.p1 GENE.c15784_g1_i1~~c15784_g1_i1.p1  ORF type:complete len:656 (-),score=259.21 c15784_g1_i1:41-2008(-)